VESIERYVREGLEEQFTNDIEGQRVRIYYLCDSLAQFKPDNPQFKVISVQESDFGSLHQPSGYSSAETLRDIKNGYET